MEFPALQIFGCWVDFWNSGSLSKIFLQQFQFQYKNSSSGDIHAKYIHHTTIDNILEGYFIANGNIWILDRIKNLTRDIEQHENLALNATN